MYSMTSKAKENGKELETPLREYAKAFVTDPNPFLFELTTGSCERVEVLEVRISRLGQRMIPRLNFHMLLYGTIEGLNIEQWR